MFFKFQCSKCGKSLKARDEAAGRKTRCPYCKTSIAIPMPSGVDLGLPPDPLQGGDFPGVDLTQNAGSAKSQDSAPQQTAPVHHAPAGGAPSSDGSNVSLVTSGIIGFACAVIVFAALYPLKAAGLRIGDMFWDSVHINFPTTLLMFWSFAILIMKSRQLAVQKSAMLFDLLPTEISKEITLDSLDKFVAHIYALPSEARNSILVNRVLRGIEHFRVRKSAAETVTMMESQSAIDAANVAGSYTIVKVFIWAMPILGFIGTVMGVSSAVAGLSATLENAADVSAVASSMKSVFGGLGTAFDTTLLALIMSMLVKIPTSAMQKSEDGLVTTTDEYCNENLLRRLNDGREGGAERGGGGPGETNAFRKAIEEAMGTHHAELENWLAKLDAIGGKLTSQVSKGWIEVSEKMATEQEKQLRQTQKQLSEMKQAAASIQETLAQLAEQTGSLQNHVADTVAQSNGTLSTHFAGLEKGLGELNSVLQSLGDKQVVVQQVEKKRRGWFG